MREGAAPEGGERLPVSLCLAGGGYAGALFELGAVAGLVAGLRGWSPVRSARVVGTSAGAVVGALLAYGIEPGALPGAAGAGDRESLAFRRSDFARPSWRTHLRSLVQGRLPPGLFTNAGLAALVKRAARQAGLDDRFDALPVPLAVVATDLDRGERAVFGPAPGEPVPVSAAVRASGAIPVYFEPVRIGERDFIDGQILDPLHLDLAAPAGVEAVLAVSALTPFRLPPGGEHVRSFGPWAISDQSARVSAEVKLAAARDRLARQRPEVAVLLVVPEAEDVGLLLRARFDRGFREAAWRLGYDAAARALAREDSTVRRIRNAAGDLRPASAGATSSPERPDPSRPIPRGQS